MSKKLPVAELTRRAFIDAEIEQMALAAAWGKDSPEYAEAMGMAAQYRCYRLKRWGRTQFEKFISESKLVDVRAAMLAKSTAK